MLWETELGNARVKGTLHGSVVQLEGVLCVCVCVCVCVFVCVYVCVTMYCHTLPWDQEIPPPLYRLLPTMYSRGIIATGYSTPVHVQDSFI